MCVACGWRRRIPRGYRDMALLRRTAEIRVAKADSGERFELIGGITRRGAAVSQGVEGLDQMLRQLQVDVARNVDDDDPPCDIAPI